MRTKILLPASCKRLQCASPTAPVFCAGAPKNKLKFLQTIQAFAKEVIAFNYKLLVNIFSYND